MSTFYFSGIEKHATAKALGKEQASDMISQLRYTANLMATCDEQELTLVMDSGAYTMLLSRADIDRYASLIRQLGDRCVWYANADVIGDQAASIRNYQYLLSLLPENLHDRILWIYQASADIKYLYEGIEKHRRLGVGGLVPLLSIHNKDRASGIETVKKIADIIGGLAEPHYFGLGNVELIEYLHTCHGKFSVDNTTWLVGTRYGQLVNDQGQQRPANEGGYDFSREAILTQNIRTMRKWVEVEPTKAPKPIKSPASARPAHSQLALFSI